MTEKKPLTHISSRLHPEYDADLIEKIEKIPRRDRSRFYRDALRLQFEHIENNEKKRRNTT